MALDVPAQRSRRAILAGTAGALAALAATAIGRADPVSAHDPQDIRLGGQNTTQYITILTNTADHRQGLVVEATGDGDGIQAITESGTGVLGSSLDGKGILGVSTSSNGVHGMSEQKDGVYGSSESSRWSGVYGENLSKGFGVSARCNAPAAADDDSRAAALYAENTSDGVGVWAIATHGVALYAEPLSGDAVAIKALGVTQFKRSGTLTIPANASSVTKSGIRIDAGTLVLATLQQDRAGIYVRSAVPDASGESFTIRLNTTVSSAIKVGWFLVN